MNRYTNAFFSFWGGPIPWIVIAASLMMVGCESLQTAAAELAQRNVAANIWTPEEGADFIAKSLELRTTGQMWLGQVMTIGGSIITSILATYGIVIKKAKATGSRLGGTTTVVAAP